MTITTEEQKKDLIEAGKRLAVVLATLREKVAPGVTTDKLDELAERMIREGGDEPAFLGYTSEGSVRPYPATLCVSINDEVVHGIPNETVKTLKEGDIVGLDLGLRHNGIIVDAAVTVPVGRVGNDVLKLLSVTEAALDAGVAAAKAGKYVGDISHAIQQTIEGEGLKVIRELGGHGVGDVVHEEPFVPNYGWPSEGEELVEGMVLALEPITTAGKTAILLMPDGYTYRTKDGSKSAHFEHTILIEKGGARVVTAL